MALAKIELKLGKKTITLTPAQFEELKQDMRNLDKTYNYFWYSNPWPQRWWGGTLTYPSYPPGQIYCNTAGTGTTTTTAGSTMITGKGTASMANTPSATSDKVTYDGSMLKIT